MALARWTYKALLSLIILVAVVFSGGAVASDAAFDEIEDEESGAVSKISLDVEQPILSTSSQIEENGDETNQENETTPPQHENPDEVSEQGDSERLQLHLESILSERLSESTASVDDRDYEQANISLGSEYDEILENYRNVADEDSVEMYATAQEAHQEFTDADGNFESIRIEYEQARQEGDDQRARALAGELEEEATRILDSGDALINSYDEIQSNTNDDYETEIETIEARQEAAEAYVERFNEAEFVDTQLDLSAEGTEASFDDPLTISGQLLTDSGEAIDDRTITLAVGQRLYTVETDNTGQFELAYRPVHLSTDETTLNVQYRPDSSSSFGATNETVPITVTPVDSTVVIDEYSTSASFGDNVTAIGTVVAGENDRSVSEVEVSLLVDDQRLETVQTDDDGRFSFSAPVPRSIGDGETAIIVRIENQNRAVATSNDSVTTLIESTETALTVQAELTDESAEQISIRGSLETDAGVPIDNETVSLDIDGEEVDSVETDENGILDHTITVPDTEADSVTIESTFDGSESNLESSNNERTVRIPRDEAAPSLLPFDMRDILLVSGGTITLFGIATAWLIRRDPVSDDERFDIVGTSLSSDPQVAQEVSQKLLRSANERVDAGAYEEAIILSYAAVRRRLGHRPEITDASTHWELYNSYVESGFDQSSELAEIVQQYERVTFASEQADEVRATQAIEAAERVLKSIDQLDM
ncbi:hypothetical protein [Natronocalculus amylovorans]|uniref:DUF4129 domain-containing protein n=1 Tax=Natronocalculus amylovorans TaxID=2917812 RepID=A0AAE3FZL8_9EURY|nr:hypothetical protein [Natronocalculus amylovorans]MCL9818287.1 hypothetical protein [Natronocalculus amylovorans]